MSYAKSKNWNQTWYQSLHFGQDKNWDQTWHLYSLVRIKAQTRPDSCAIWWRWQPRPDLTSVQFGQDKSPDQTWCLYSLVRIKAQTRLDICAVWSGLFHNYPRYSDNLALNELSKILADNILFLLFFIIIIIIFIYLFIFFSLFFRHIFWGE